ncbi:MAG: hypothetical protein ACTTJS_03200 [Wolinella sp.]
MNACKWTPQAMSNASTRLQDKLTNLQSKLMKLQYTSKRPIEYLIMQELVEDCKEHLERYISELDELDRKYSERLSLLEEEQASD